MFEKPGLVCDKATSVGYSLRKEKKTLYLKGFITTFNHWKYYIIQYRIQYVLYTRVYTYVFVLVQSRMYFGELILQLMSLKIPLSETEAKPIMKILVCGIMLMILASCKTILSLTCLCMTSRYSDMVIISSKHQERQHEAILFLYDN